MVFTSVIRVNTWITVINMAGDITLNRFAKYVLK